MPASCHVYNYSFVYVRECLCIMFTSVYVKRPELFGGGEKRWINKHYLFISCIALFLNHVTGKAHVGERRIQKMEESVVGKEEVKVRCAQVFGWTADGVSAGLHMLLSISDAQSS